MKEDISIFIHIIAVISGVIMGWFIGHYLSKRNARKRQELADLMWKEIENDLRKDKAIDMYLSHLEDKKRAEKENG